MGLPVSGSAQEIGVLVEPGLDVIHHNSATPTDATYARTYDFTGVSFTDVTAAFGSLDLDVTLFPDDSDEVLIGMAAAFEVVDFTLGTVASGGGIAPLFFYSVAAGTVATSFSPIDETEGFRQSGPLVFESSDLAGWVATTVDGQSAFWIRIQRTRNTLSTPPVEDIVQVDTPTEYGWDSNGDVNFKSLALSTALTVANGGTGSTTLADGGVLVGSGTGAVTVLALGSSGQVLTSNGAGADPSMQDAAGGGTPWLAWPAEAGLETSGSLNAQFTVRNGHGLMAFDDTTIEYIVFEGPGVKTFQTREFMIARLQGRRLIAPGDNMLKLELTTE
ncbi:hypothetical protein LCGC14_2974900, partial [marine sediment metagenome]